MKKKKLTIREKNSRRESKRELQESGIIPKDKPKLNRKKFAIQVVQDFDKEISLISINDTFLLRQALEWMIGVAGNEKTKTKISQEQVGVLKAMKIATDYKRFEENKRALGINSWTLGELYNQVIKPVIDL